MVGLSVDDLLGLVATRIGPGNAALITTAYEFVSKYVEANGVGGIFDALTDLSKLEEFAGFDFTQMWKDLGVTDANGNIDPQAILNKVIEAGLEFAKKELPGMMLTEVLPKLIPATNTIKTVIDLAAWLKDNAVEVAGLVEQFAAQLSRIAAGDPASIQAAGEGIRTGLQRATPAVINLVIKLAAGKVDQKIDKLTDKVRGVGDKIKDKLGGLIDKFAGAAVKRLAKGGGGERRRATRRTTTRGWRARWWTGRRARASRTCTARVAVRVGQLFRRIAPGADQPSVDVDRHQLLELHAGV